MSTVFVTRHPGARDWLARHGHSVDRTVDELTAADIAALSPGDTIIGTLPVALAAAVCARGARYFNLVIPSVPRELRGQELDADMLEQLGTRIEAFDIRAGEPSEDVLVLPRCAMPMLPAAAAWPWQATPMTPAWLPRAQAEVDEHYLQLVPYVLLLDALGNAWCYRRSGGDNRIQGRLSCGVGGHVERIDAAVTFDATLERALRRELCEELGPAANSVHPIGPLAWLYEHESAIGRVHLGVLYVARWPHRRVPQTLEATMQAQGFRPLGELSADADCEYWSRLAAGFLITHPLTADAGHD